MKLLLFVLQREELLEEVLKAFVEAGISDATIIDTERMGGYLSYEVPLFAGFKEFLTGNKPYNKTIFSIVNKGKKIKKLEVLLDKVCGGLSARTTGILFTVPVDYVRGLASEDE